MSRLTRRRPDHRSTSPSLPSTPAATIEAAASGPLHVRAAWPSLVFLAGLTVLFFIDLVVGGRTLLMRDTFCDFLPWRMFASQVLASGHLPWWNPFDGFGKPFLADPQSAVFYPPHLLFSMLPAPIALKCSWLLHIWIAAASMWAFGRHLRLDHIPSLLAAVAFAFSSVILAYMEFLSQFTAVAWLPLILLFVGRLIDTATAQSEPAQRRWRTLQTASLLALSCVVQYFAGHPETCVQTFFMALVLVIVKVWAIT